MKKSTKFALMGSAAFAATLIGRRLVRQSYTFADKSVLIIGGSRGLGLVLARRFSLEGARLTLVGRNRSTLDAAEAEIAGTGAKVMTLVLDAGCKEQAEEAVARAVQHYGSIDVLVNNAGIMEVGPIEHMSLQDFEQAMAVHAWAPLYTTLAAIPHMRRQGGGRIVNISSIGGKIAVPHMLPYTMSKFALSGLSDGMRAELRKYGIFVTTVFPGLMRTGSHVNAYFKGQNQQEFAWFSLMAGLPVFSMNAKRAASQIVEACRRGRPELIITTQARLAVLANAIAPNLAARALMLMNRLLPGPSGVETGVRSGWDSSSRWSPSSLTSLADRAIEANNEYRAAG